MQSVIHLSRYFFDMLRSGDIQRSSLSCRTQCFVGILCKFKYHQVFSNEMTQSETLFEQFPPYTQC